MVDMHQQWHHGAGLPEGGVVPRSAPHPQLGTLGVGGHKSSSGRIGLWLGVVSLALTLLGFISLAIADFTLREHKPDPVVDWVVLSYPGLMAVGAWSLALTAVTLSIVGGIYGIKEKNILGIVVGMASLALAAPATIGSVSIGNRIVYILANPSEVAAEQQSAQDKKTQSVLANSADVEIGTPVVADGGSSGFLPVIVTNKSAVPASFHLEIRATGPQIYGDYRERSSRYTGVLRPGQTRTIKFFEFSDSSFGDDTIAELLRAGSFEISLIE